MATLKVSRDSGYADLLRAYSIVINGKKVGELGNGEEKEFPVLSGRGKVSIKKGWCESEALNFVATEESPLSFRVCSNLRGPRLFLALWYVLFERDKYLLIEKTSN